jgi:tyrosinase
MKTRKNVKGLSSGEKERFVNAVLKLKKSPSVFHPNDPAFGRYDDYAEIHMNAMMAMSETDPADDADWYPGWAHNGPAFLPWHRLYLLQFEKDLQTASQDDSITIPYWDWTDNDSSPFTQDLMGSDGGATNDNSPGKVPDGPFAHDGPNKWTFAVKDDVGDPDYLTRGFGRRPDARRLPTAVQLDRVLQIQVYDNPVWKLGSPGFRTSLEVALHNLIHRWVNGTMMYMTSPNDPVFWLHHANIDRLWGEWQRHHPAVSPFLPSLHAPKGHNLYDFLLFSTGSSHPHQPHGQPGETGPPSHNEHAEEVHDGGSGSSIQTMRIVNTLSHYLLGYAYDSDPREEYEETTVDEMMSKDKSTALATELPRRGVRRGRHKITAFPTMDQII